MIKVSKAWIQASSLTLLGGTLLSAAAVFTLGEDEGLRVEVTRFPVPAPASVSALAAPTPVSFDESEVAEAPKAATRRQRRKTRPSDDDDRFEQLMARFDSLESRLTALEAGSAQPVGQLVAAPRATGGRPAKGAKGQAAPLVTGLDQRFAQIEARLKELDRLKRTERRVRGLQRRFKQAEEKVQINQLTVNEQVNLAMHTPLGQELLNKIADLESKLESVLSKRTVPAATYTNLIPGLWGTYYKDRYFTVRAGTQIDATLNYDWGGGSPELLGEQKDNFSIRWEGVIRISQPGTYSFYTVSDDGVRLWIAEQLVVAEYDDHPRQEDLIDLELEAGDYPLRLEYYEAGGAALVQLLWQFSGSERTPIPASALFHTVEQERM